MDVIQRQLISAGFFTVACDREIPIGALVPFGFTNHSCEDLVFKSARFEVVGLSDATELNNQMREIGMLWPGDWVAEGIFFYRVRPVAD